MNEVLSPTLDILSQEYVLIQAWKKTSSYIRQHNWYSDTLELDRTAINLPKFLKTLARDIKNPNGWTNDPLRIIPAPKSQPWLISENGVWQPAEKKSVASKLRPLAHADLRSQVLATAIMMCVADHIETLQHDPRDEITDSTSNVISYGNRLFCDRVGSSLRHRWGSSKLYRAYYQDYRSFIARPESIAKALHDTPSHRTVVVHSDLSQFYDRVRPELLSSKLLSKLGDSCDAGFRSITTRALSWTWNARDRAEVDAFARNSDIDGFDFIALPQGLVAAGFFANVVLLDFDDRVRMLNGFNLMDGAKLFDCVRYVDDLRIVLSVDRKINLAQIEDGAHHWIQEILSTTAPGLKASREKTNASAVHSEERPIVRQSRKMARIQSAISGGFDTTGGVEILDAVQGLIRSQDSFSRSRKMNEEWGFAPIPDVRDATVARFAAGRYRSTFRSLRPMLDAEPPRAAERLDHPFDSDLSQARRIRTQDDLDEEVRAFALGLIDTWASDPANVRLLRIGLDLWPAPDVLEQVLKLLRPFTRKGGPRKAPRRVAWYCLAEIFRAGATETGFVDDMESLPSSVDIDQYRHVLWSEGMQLLASPEVSLPWYLRQQVFMFLAAASPYLLLFVAPKSSTDAKHYDNLIRFLSGDTIGMSNEEVATNSVLARRSFSNKTQSINLAMKGISARRLEQIADLDLDFAAELINVSPALISDCSPRLKGDLCLQEAVDYSGFSALSRIVLDNSALNPLRNELSLLSFSIAFLTELKTDQNKFVIPPSDVLISADSSQIQPEIEQLRIISDRSNFGGSIYSPPAWCKPESLWRFQLGYLIRFILTARQDFTRAIKKPKWAEGTAIYRPGVNHSYQRSHAFFNGHDAFGDDWIPITDWVEHFLSGLLRWPGQRHSRGFEFVDFGIEFTLNALQARLNLIKNLRGKNSGLLMLPLTAPWPVKPAEIRPMRACVVQTVVPGTDDFQLNDLPCSGPAIRKKHRRHLSAALAAVERMLDLRETHKGSEGRLDWLILPELSVHPNDIKTHLIPFARAHKTLILTGITYQQLVTGMPLVNSAIWIVPVWDSSHGLQIRVRRQGKQHLAPLEAKFNATGETIRGFRPCQWLIGYEWSSAKSENPLWLTAAICYDATDLNLAADLRNRSDIFAIPALNQDVGTFDQMSLALHYHMFQMVIVANNGQFGGSNAYAPYKKPYLRQVFHLHGQPQASIAFLEIDPVSVFQQRKEISDGKMWKSPPAGL